MKKLNPIEYLTGFLMGSFLGIFGDCLFLILLRFLRIWLEQAKLEIPWWMLIPLPLLFGLGMGKAIADLHLEDY